MNLKTLNKELEGVYRECTPQFLIECAFRLHEEVCQAELEGKSAFRKSYELSYLTLLLEDLGYQCKERNTLFIRDSKSGELRQSISNPFIEF